MKDAKSAESNEKSNLKNSNFDFTSYGHFLVIFLTSSPLFSLKKITKPNLANQT